MANLDVALNTDPANGNTTGASADVPAPSPTAATAERLPVQGHWTLVNHLLLTLAELGIPVVSGQGQFTLTDKQQNL